jgi:lysine-N-methylase
MTRPAYAESFVCIGSACEDTCCHNWTVAIDQPTYEKYQHLPPGPLRSLLDATIRVNPPVDKGGIQAGRSEPPIFAIIQLNDAHRCPMLQEDHHCRIQTECGPEYLSHTCATYPRIVRQIGPVVEVALALSCPQAARLVLLNPDLLNSASRSTGQEHPSEESGPQLASDGATQGTALLRASFWPIRESVLALVQNRAYPLWQRVFLLGILCRRLDSIAKGDIKGSVPGFLRRFENAVVSGSLRGAMEVLPFDAASQLDMVLRLSGMMLHHSYVGPRFVECVNAFTAGIGNGPGATLETLAGHYTMAHDRYYEPFFNRYPYILDNYLVNTIIRCQFPFGRDGMVPDVAMTAPTASMASEYTVLIAQFALMKGLLIGVAGCHRENFTTEHVVHTVQVASRHFEHHPEFLNMARALLAEHQMDDARGLAVLLRNRAPGAWRPASPEIGLPAQPMARPS